MKRLILAIILLTTSLCAKAQEEYGSRIFVTMNYTKNIFARNPLSGIYTRSSMPYAATYINSYRKTLPEGSFALLNFGEGLPFEYEYTTSFHTGEGLLKHMGYNEEECVSVAGKKIGFVELGDDLKENVSDITVFRETHSPDYLVGIFLNTRDNRTARYGLDISLSAKEVEPGEFFSLSFDEKGGLTRKVITSDILRGLTPDREYLAWASKIEEDINKIRITPAFDRPLENTLKASDSFFGPSPYDMLFHRFQLSVIEADISLFAPVNGDHVIEAGEPRLIDIYKAFTGVTDEEMTISTVRLKGSEIKTFLENSYGRWFRRMKNPSDDMLYCYRGANGKLYPSASRRNYSAAGVSYTVNLTKPKGNMIKMGDMSDGSAFDPERYYSVAIFRNKLNDYGLKILEDCSIDKPQLETRLIRTGNGPYPELLIRMLNLYRAQEGQWKIVPEAWAESASERLKDELFR